MAYPGSFYLIEAEPLSKTRTKLRSGFRAVSGKTANERAGPMESDEGCGGTLKGLLARSLPQPERLMTFAHHKKKSGHPRGTPNRSNGESLNHETSLLSAQSLHWKMGGCVTSQRRHAMIVKGKCPRCRGERPRNRKAFHGLRMAKGGNSGGLLVVKSRRNLSDSGDGRVARTQLLHRSTSVQLYHPVVSTTPIVIPQKGRSVGQKLLHAKSPRHGTAPKCLASNPGPMVAKGNHSSWKRNALGCMRASGVPPVSKYLLYTSPCGRQTKHGSNIFRKCPTPRYCYVRRLRSGSTMRCISSSALIGYEKGERNLTKAQCYVTSS